MKQMKDKLYFHSDKCEMVCQFRDVCEANDFYGETPESETNAKYTGYEIEIEGYWTENGNFFATHLMGIPLEKQVKL